MNVRIATAQDAAGIVALHRAANPFEGWFRNPFQSLGPAPYEELTPFERYLHGGFWMDLGLFRRHYHEYRRRGFPVFVAEHGGRIVGECEVWLDEEPAPFGRYAEVEMLETSPPHALDVERELLSRAADRVAKAGYAALDMSPEHGGSRAAAENLGFAPLWDTRTFDAKTKSIPKPEVEFETRYLGGDYGDLSAMLALNHREPPRWRFETVTALWPAAELAGVADAQKVTAMAVDAEGIRFAVVASRRAWLEPAVSEIDVWMDPTDLELGEKVRVAFRVAVEIARRLGTKTVRAYAPAPTADPLQDSGFSGGDETATWLRWTF